MFRQPFIESNNELHEAILARDNDRAIELARTMPKGEVNHKSLGNTPLMLALKTANFPVAIELLKRIDIEVIPRTPIGDRASDKRGVTPLQLACAWKHNEIIHLILDKYKQHIEKIYYEDSNENKKLSDKDLHDILFIKSNSAVGFEIRMDFIIGNWPGLHSIMRPMIQNRSTDKIYKYQFSEKDIQKEYFKSIIDRPGLIIICAPELTDAILFHSRLICLNLGLKSEADFSQHHSSQFQFASDLKIGLKAIVEHIAKQEPDPHLQQIFSPDGMEIEQSPTLTRK